MMFHKNLEARRKLKGFTQETLAIEAGVVRQTVSKWEKGLSVPDADMLQRLAEILEVSVSQLLGADIPEAPESRNEMAEQLARINEQLAIQNRRARRVWKGVLIALIIVLVIPLILAAVLFLGLTVYQGDKAAGEAKWVCSLKGEKYEYSAEYDDDYRIITAGGSAYIGDRVDAENCGDANQLSLRIKDYFESKGGTVSVQSRGKGLNLLE